MPECEFCDGHVSDAFARVYGGNDDQPLRCPGCATTRELMEGAAARGGAA